MSPSSPPFFARHSPLVTASNSFLSVFYPLRFLARPSPAVSICLRYNLARTLQSHYYETVQQVGSPHMATRDFKVFLEPDEGYGGYVVVCPSLPGCYSQGKSVSEALANIREAINLCLEDMESRGEEIPDPNDVLIGSVIVNR